MSEDHRDSKKIAGSMKKVEPQNEALNLRREQLKIKEMALLIIAAGVIYFVGHLLTHFFERSKIPDVLMLILCGIVAGPLTGLMTVERIGYAGELFTQMALIIILFEGGLGLELTHLLKSARRSVLLSSSFFAISALAVALIMHFGFDYSPMASAVTGFICGGTSSAVVIPLLVMIRVSKGAGTMLIIESALTDVLCIVFTLGVLQSIDSGEFRFGNIVGSLVSSLIVASIIGVICGLVWLRCINWVRSFSNTQFATCFFMFIVYGMAEVMHFSGAIAALAFGIVLGNADVVSRNMRRIFGDSMPVGVISDAEKKLYRELVFLVKIFFFLYLGISIPFESHNIIVVAVTIVIVLFILRPFAARFLTGRTSRHDRAIIAVMLPKGLAAAVLAGLPAQYGMVEGPYIQAITYHVVLSSIILTSVLIPLIEKTSFGQYYEMMCGGGHETSDPPISRQSDPDPTLTSNEERDRAAQQQQPQTDGNE